VAVLNALRETPGALLRNPVVFVPVVVLMLFQAPQIVLQTVNPLVGSLVSLTLSLLFVFVTPFFQAGLIGMADEALDGTTSLQTFLGAGKANYVSVLVAYLVLVAVNFAVGFVGLFVAIFGGVAFFGDTTGGPSPALLAVVGAVAAAVVLAYLLFVFLVQFYGQAIVVSGLDAVAALKHSVSVVRHHLASALGYSVLVGVLGAAAGGVFALGASLATPRSSHLVSTPQSTLLGAVAVAALLAVVGSLFGGFFGVFSVAFYRRIDATGGPETV
jgi:hypothetical protein